LNKSKNNLSLHELRLKKWEKNDRNHQLPNTLKKDLNQDLVSAPPGHPDFHHLFWPFMSFKLILKLT